MVGENFLSQVDIPDGMTVGVSVYDFKTDQWLGQNQDQHFQLASVVKVPIMVAAMRQRDAGRFKLEDRHILTDADKVSYGILCYLDAGLALTWRDLITLMIIQSCNTATDIVLNGLGGVAAVNDAMREIGMPEIVVRQTIRELLFDLEAIAPLMLTDYERQAYEREHAVQPQPELAMQPNHSNFSTPRQMTELFRRLYVGELASPDSTREMMTILSRQQLNERMPALLPLEMQVAHKTGSIGGVRNDAGILITPQGHAVAASIFIHYPRLDYSTSEGKIWLEHANRVISELGRVIYEELILNQA